MIQLGYATESRITATQKMTKPIGLKSIRFLVLWVLVIAIASCKQPSVTEQIAKTYGLDSYGQIEAIRYTFNLQFPGVNLSRTWTWEPKTGQVTYEAKDKDGKPVKVTYVRSQLSSQSDMVKNEVDPGFINDNYWFQLPFHVYWDTSATVQDKGTQPLPQGNGTAKLVSIKYPSDVGYTPGDTWEIFVGADNRIEEFVFHRGGSKKPTVVVASWGDYKMAGPLLVSLDRRGTGDGNPLRVSFSDVSVKLVGSNTWVNAQ